MGMPPDRPRRRSDLTIVRRQVADEVFFVVADPRTHEYVRFGEVEHAIFDLLDGTRTLPEVAEAFERLTGAGIDQEDLAAFVEGLQEQELVETAAFDPVQILEEFRERERSGLSRRRLVTGSLALLKFPPFNPDRLLGRLAAHIQWCWSRSAFIAAMVLMAGATLLAAATWDRLAPAYTAFLGALVAGSAADTAAKLLMLYTLGGILLAIHETAHGVTLKHYGGTVPEMGLALAYFQFPGAYTDTTASYLLPSRFQRVMVSLSGGYTGLIAAAISVFVWWATPPGSLLNDAALITILLGGPLTLLFNWNPLVPYDGYYMATDIFEAPNLLPRSFAYIGDLIRKRLFRAPPVHPSPPVRLRRVYLVYGALAWAYQGTWVLMVPYAAYLLFSRVGGTLLGGILAGIVTVRFAQSPMATVARFIQSVRSEKEGGRRRRRLVGVGTAVGAAAGLAVIFTPACPLHVHGAGILAPAARAEVRASTSGLVSEILVVEGEPVAAGRPLVRLESPDLHGRLEQARLERDRALAESIRDEARGDLTEAARGRAERGRLDAEIDLLRGRFDRLTLRAPMDGILIGPRLRDRIGTYLAEGDLWCEVAREEPLRVDVPVLENDLADVAEGARVVVASSGFPGKRFEGKVVAVPAQGGRVGTATAGVAAASGPPPGGMASYQVRAELIGRGGLRPGMSVAVRIEGRRMSLAHRAGRAAFRLFRGRIWW